MAANRPDSGQNRASDPSLRPSWPIRTPVDSVAAAIRDASGEHGRGQAARMLLHRRSLPTAPGSVTEVIAGTPACSEAPRRSSRGRSTHRPSRDLTGPGRRTRASARTGRLAERAGEPIQAATEAREGSHGGWGARHQPCDPQASARTLHASPATWHVRCWKVTTLETGPAARRRSRPPPVWPHSCSRTSGLHRRRTACPFPPRCPGWSRVPWAELRRSLRAALACRARDEAYPRLRSALGCGRPMFSERPFDSPSRAHPHMALDSDGHGGEAGSGGNFRAGSVRPQTCAPGGRWGLRSPPAAGRVAPPRGHRGRARSARP